ncbi:melanocortin receptor 3-like [Mya arenaria]|uniref:melanocortin receptor 3-like n=1 Tax=Mya arenaria TaxID=6604 RepID=UPI0022E3F977|nr:melanocortin receptor 3-like [Mya arenaria]
MPVEQFIASIGANVSYDQYSNMTLDFLTEIMWPFTKPYSPLAEKALVKPIYIVIIVLCSLATITNCVAIVSTCRVKYYQTLHLKLIVSLCASNVLIVIAILAMVVNKIANSKHVVGMSSPENRATNACAFATVNSLKIMGFLTSLLNLLAMALDHYIAVIVPLRYPKIMTKPLGIVLICIIWVVSAIGGFSNIVLGLLQNDKSRTEVFHFCELVMYDRYNAEILVCIITAIFVIAVTFIYIQLCCKFRALKKETQMTPGANYSLHKYTAIMTTIIIIVCFILCLVPYIVFQMIMIGLVNFNKDVVYTLFNSLLVASKYLHVLLITNCLAHPFIYAVRSKIMKGGYKSLFMAMNREKKITGGNELGVFDGTPGHSSKAIGPSCERVDEQNEEERDGESDAFVPALTK